uniref:Uncharacterized protein n=1 Tax=Ditylenchus dipsaci TaxID=166011 RepID=A0A915DG21_9BILA
HQGYSFYLAICGMLGFMLCFLVGILATILVFVHDTNQHTSDLLSLSTTATPVSKQHRTFPKRPT